MGKWTLEYHDEVLRNKMKSLVAGSVKRMKLEKGEPTITYEAFVEELDEGDSFTASMIDLLVKEMAERRTRPSAADRRLISDRTAKSLRMQATQLHVYRNRQGRERITRRHAPISTETRPYPFMSDSEGEDEYGTLLGGGSVLEGARIPSDLYDAFLPAPPSYHPRSIDTGAPSPEPAGSTDPATVTSPRPTSPQWPMPVIPPSIIRSGWPTASTTYGGSSSTTRHSTIRRPHRSRTLDFNEFTTRRRSAIRQHISPEREIDTRPSSASTSEFMHTVDRPGESSTSTYTAPGTSNARRHFPLASGQPTAIRQLLASRHASGVSVSMEPSSSATPIAVETTDGSNPSSSQLWYSLTGSPEPTFGSFARSSSSLDLNEDRRSVVAPRLRRGGLRPPEALLSRYATPGGDTSDGTGVGPTTESGETIREGRDFMPAQSIQLLTPRSPSPTPAAEARLP